MRVTKFVCPSCEGSGQFKYLKDLPCMWCHGEKRIMTHRALHYAMSLWTIAGGGFVLGDHDEDTKLEMENRAEKIYELAGVIPPWRGRA